jgi:precorrin isomerase
MTEQTTRDYAEEAIQSQRRENTAREATAELLAQAIEASAEPTLAGHLRTQEWRLASGNQTELTIRRADGIVLTIVVTAREM